MSGLEKYLERAERLLAEAYAERDGLKLEVERLEGVMTAAHDELMNLQPHIPQACIPGHEGFIDDHVDAAMKILVPVAKQEDEA